MPTVLIAGDICPIEGNRPYFRKGDAETLVGDLLPEFQTADLSLANLECPFIERPSPIRKTGPTFGVENDCIDAFKAIGIQALGLANNHIMDHGAEGLQNTLKVCAQAGIRTVGAGKDLATARELLIQEVRGIRIGIMAVAEHEFSVSANGSWGANPLDIPSFVRTVEREKSRFDYLIVLLHGSHEFLIPTPRIKDTCHFLVEQGANAVIVQHPHCVGGWENYLGGHIVYGQGAFLMDEGLYRNLKIFHEGVLIKLKISNDFTSTIEFIPFVQSSPAPGARRMNGEKETAFREHLTSLSESLQNDDWVQAQWLSFCEQKKFAYLSAVLGHNRILRKLNKRGFLARWFYRKQEFLSVRNMVCCETHREALETIFKRLM